MEGPLKRSALEGTSTEMLVANGEECVVAERNGRRRVLLCGVGSMGKIYMSVAAAACVTIVRAVRRTAEMEEALKTEEVDAVVIASPKQFHVEQVLLAARYKKRILCEKPLGLSVADAAAIAAAGVPIVAAFQRRFDAHFRAAHAQLGSVGQLQLIRIISRDPPSTALRDATSIIFDSFVHDADIACWFANTKPISCVAVMTQTGASCTRCATTIEFENGVVALSIYDQGITYGYEQRLELHGTLGSLMVENPLVNSVVTHCHNRTSQSGPISDSYGTRYRDAYTAELRALFDDSPPAVDHSPAHWCCEQALISIQARKFAVPFAAFTSAESKARPIVRKRLAVGRVALVGCGRMGQIRARLIADHPRLKLAYLVDVRREAAQGLAKALGIADVKVATALDKDVLSAVDAVWIATGTNEHIDLIRRAGSTHYVAVEKPVSNEAKEIDEAFDACSDLMVSFQRFFDPEFETTARTTEPCSIISATGDHPCPPKELLRQLGSIFHDLLIHDVSYSVRVTSSLPVRVWALGGSFDSELRAVNVFDTAALIIEYSNGSVSAHSARRASACGYDQRTETVCSHGSLAKVRNPTSVQSSRFGASRIGETTAGQIAYSFGDRYAVAYAREVHHFAEMMVSGASPRVTRSHCKVVGAVCDAALHSATNKRICRFDWH